MIANKKDLPCIALEPEWIVRLRFEHKELKEKCTKLRKMLVAYEAGTLNFKPNCSLELLKRQLSAMEEYLFALEMRGLIEGRDL